MDDLPELPFEKVLSYLDLKDRLKARTVSRAWRNTFDRYPVNTLCYSSDPIDFIHGKSRWVNGAFAENFISSTRYASFFDTFGETILSTLKRLRLCDLHLSGNGTAFARILNSFGQLEQLDIIRAVFIDHLMSNRNEFHLNLPMLTSLHLKEVEGILKLTLEAPRLRDVRILNYCLRHLRVEIVHGESVERLLVDDWRYIDLKKLKNLQYLYVKSLPAIDPTFLSSLQQLKEIHLQSKLIHLENNLIISKLFERKQQSGRADLKIYLCGLLLNGPDDPAINALEDSTDCLCEEWLVCLAENLSRLADEIPFYRRLGFPDIVNVAPGLEVDLLKRCTELKEVTVFDPVEDTQRFLNLLKNFENIGDLNFRGDQPQDLFDRLSEHCAVQKLTLHEPPSDLAFLFRLKHLIHLELYYSINSKTVRRALEELPALFYFAFRYGQNSASIQIDRVSKQFHIFFGKKSTGQQVSGLNAAIEFIFGKEKPSRLKRRKVEELE